MRTVKARFSLSKRAYYNLGGRVWPPIDTEGVVLHFPALTSQNLAFNKSEAHPTPRMKFVATGE
jgi:hypothetical protein